MASRRITVTATGDSFITRRLVRTVPSTVELSRLISAADVRFTNFEVTAHDGAGYPAAVSGGTWAMAAPEVIGDLQVLGFNLVSTANNHALDYSTGGLLATDDNLSRAGLAHAGAGANLAAACAPVFVETERGRVGMVAATSTFDKSWVAGDQRPDLQGRPGLNVLHHKVAHKVSSAQLATLRQILEDTSINATYDRSVATGFVVPVEDPNAVLVGGHLFVDDTDPRPTSTADTKDVARIVRSIERARGEADYVLVSLHNHEMLGSDLERPAEFAEKFARDCIDAGADAVIGHGPHILRGIEIYRGKPIFYSLGNFIFESDSVAHLPADFFAAYGLTHHDDTFQALRERSRNWTRGFSAQPEIWSSVVAKWTVEDDGAIEIRLHPIDLGHTEPHYRRGEPRLTGDTTAIEKLQELSAPYGTRIDIEAGVGVIRIGPRDQAPAGERAALRASV
ncbi:CapA family protein [Amycolatopsis sp. GM8]|uniref:CapA family protein n=1 Tax=Amycolatopsis sp. GM8 TaxID=2896530 RepID=UPI001F1EA0DE|nr:CapA family protein [Amycolatopsis sp. GM8]